LEEPKIMKSKLLYFKVLLIALIFTSPVYSQIINGSVSNEDKFRFAKELFAAEKYGAALHEFESIKEQSKAPGIKKGELEFYIAVCNIEMKNKAGRVGRQQSIISNQQSPDLNADYFV